MFTNNRFSLLIVMFAAFLLFSGMPPLDSAQAAVIHVYPSGDTTGATDSAAIQSAINSASTGDTILLAAGTYYIDKNIQIRKSHVTLKGEGAGQTIIKYAGSVYHSMIYIGYNVQPTTHVEVADLTLDGDSNPNIQHGIFVTNGSHHWLHHLEIKDLEPAAEGILPLGIMFSGQEPEPGVYQNAVTDSIISDNTMSNIGVNSIWGGGIRVRKGSSHNQIVNNTIVNTGRGGIFCSNGSTDLIIRNNTVSGSGLAQSGSGLGIELFNECDRSIVEDNVVDHWISLDRASYSAVRRNTVSTAADTIKSIGLELVGSNHVIFTDNIVDGGQRVGFANSNTLPKEYVFFGHNTIKHVIQWAINIQGQDGGASYYYIYNNTLLNTIGDDPRATGPNPGTAIRFNGNSHHITFDGNTIKDNDLHVLLLTKGIDQISVINNEIMNNGGKVYNSIPAGMVDLEWDNNTVSGNGNNSVPNSMGFSNHKPTASFTSVSTVNAGQPISFTNTSTDSDGTIDHVLWDFGDGLPSDDMHPTYTYQNPGTYRVTMLVWDDEGRGDLAEKWITVQ